MTLAGNFPGGFSWLLLKGYVEMQSGVWENRYKKQTVPLHKHPLALSLSSSIPPPMKKIIRPPNIHQKVTSKISLNYQTNFAKFLLKWSSECFTKEIITRKWRNANSRVKSIVWLKHFSKLNHNKTYRYIFNINRLNKNNWFRLEHTNHRRFKIYHNSSRNVFSCTSLTEESVKGIVSATNCFISRHVAIRLNSMLQAVQFPTRITNLNACLSDVNWNTLSLSTKNQPRYLFTKFFRLPCTAQSGDLPTNTLRN